MAENNSGQHEYEETIRGFKKWAMNELIYGIPLMYAIGGFAFIGIIISFLIGVISIITGWRPPEYAVFVVFAISLFWAYGGWLEGRKEQERMRAEMMEDGG